MCGPACGWRFSSSVFRRPLATAIPTFPGLRTGLSTTVKRTLGFAGRIGKLTGGFRDFPDVTARWIVGWKQILVESRSPTISGIRHEVSQEATVGRFCNPSC